MSKISVLDDSRNVLFRAHEEEAERLVETHRARWTNNHRAIRLSHDLGEPGHGRTRTARGGILGLIGRGQKYTIENRQGMVTGFKRIFSEDRPLFNLATIEACKT